MTVWLNGERIENCGASNIAELARCYDLQPHAILIEHNGRALRQKEWTQRPLTDGDRIEFVRVVAGG
ncbi:MAG: sulfur carrier protein ThiS [Chthoniobacterales bacterium]